MDASTARDSTIVRRKLDFLLGSSGRLDRREVISHLQNGFGGVYNLYYIEIKRMDVHHKSIKMLKHYIILYTSYTVYIRVTHMTMEGSIMFIYKDLTHFHPF